MRPMKGDTWQLLLPVIIVLGRISVDRFVQSTMYSEIRLLVASQVQFPDGHLARNGFLENGRLDGNTLPNDLVWQPNIN